jgi:Lon protease-like protein
MSEIPLFPLNTVLFPQGILPLRIFEPRYVDMVSACMKTGSGFGVCLVRDGSDVGAAAKFYTTGTLATIVDWNQLPDGLLGIRVQGQQRFTVLSSRVKPDQLITAEVEMIPDDPHYAIPAMYAPLQDLLRRGIQQLGRPYTDMPTDYDNASWVSCRLAELLPLPLTAKQEFLQSTKPVERLEQLFNVWQKMNTGQN